MPHPRRQKLQTLQTLQRLQQQEEALLLLLLLLQLLLQLLLLLQEAAIVIPLDCWRYWQTYDPSVSGRARTAKSHAASASS